MICMLCYLRDGGDQSDIKLSSNSCEKRQQEHSTCETTLAAPAQECNSCQGADQFDQTKELVNRKADPVVPEADVDLVDGRKCDVSARALCSSRAVINPTRALVLQSRCPVLVEQ